MYRPPPKKPIRPIPIANQGRKPASANTPSPTPGGNLPACDIPPPAEPAPKLGIRRSAQSATPSPAQPETRFATSPETTKNISPNPVAQTPRPAQQTRNPDKATHPAEASRPAAPEREPAPQQQHPQQQHPRPAAETRRFRMRAPSRQRRTIIIEEDASSPWKIPTLLLFFILLGAGAYFYLNRPDSPRTALSQPAAKPTPAPNTTQPSVAAPPEQPEVVNLTEIESNPEKDGPLPTPVFVFEEPEDEAPVQEEKAEVKTEPFVSKLPEVKPRKYEKPSMLDLEVWDKIRASRQSPLPVPLGDTNAERQALATLVSQYSSIPPEKTVANPNANIFPGAVPAEAKRVRLTLNLSREVQGWQSTGAYAAPGERITVRLNPADISLGLRVIIGCHTDDLFQSKREIWKRFPRISRSFALNSVSTEIANAFGGSIYIDIPARARNSGRLRVEILGAVEAPLYELGKTTPEQWKHIRGAPAPWAELVCRTISLSVPSESIRKLEDPEILMRLWEKIIDDQDWLAALPRRKHAPERLVPDVQISGGFMHSGYPVMCHMGSAWAMTSHERLTTKGDWGFFHEFGHNRQRSEWTFDGFGEVTCNLFALYCMETIAGKKYGGRDDLDEHLRNKLADPVRNDLPDDNLAVYVPVIRSFGWEPLRKTFAEYYKNHQYLFISDVRKREIFVRLWSKNTKANL
ncbi:MAG: M60 family metallopeptidase, partial [Puniceicoccales bacterium]|nr:M60 family metallopeptidase [Puniceicoccales bacterium]